MARITWPKLFNVDVKHQIKQTNNNEYQHHMSRAMRKPAFCICENKDADQLHGNCKADQRLYFRYIDSSIPLLPKSEISSLWPSLAVQPGLCWTRSIKYTPFLIFFL